MDVVALKNHAMTSSAIIYRATAPNDNTSSPMVIRMCAELKLRSSEIRHLVVSSSLLNNMACLLIVSTVITTYFSSYFNQNHVQIVFLQLS
ncbi:hypothetical protein KSP40_PGU017730 [Platanthera guangdongensis]|uniref:Uncharacterized protein n=1 Tax=Platanthera guangdongensis TaxID=2320717 RepID=A0ABR2N5J3_9ASPA